MRSGQIGESSRTLPRLEGRRAAAEGDKRNVLSEGVIKTVAAQTMREQVSARIL